MRSNEPSGHEQRTKTSASERERRAALDHAFSAIMAFTLALARYTFMKIALFHNPGAGERAPDGSQLIRHFAEAGYDVIYVPTNMTKSSPGMSFFLK
jgi:hypothetical protein